MDINKRLIVYDGIVDKTRFSETGLLFMLKESVEDGLRGKYIKEYADHNVCNLVDIAKEQVYQQVNIKAVH